MRSPTRSKLSSQIFEFLTLRFISSGNIGCTSAGVWTLLRMYSRALLIGDITYPDRKELLALCKTSLQSQLCVGFGHLHLTTIGQIRTFIGHCLTSSVASGEFRSYTKAVTNRNKTYES